MGKREKVFADFFRRYDFTTAVSSRDKNIDIDKMMAHILDCVVALTGVLDGGCFHYDRCKADIFWLSILGLIKGNIKHRGIESISSIISENLSPIMQLFPNQKDGGCNWFPYHWALCLASFTDESVLLREELAQAVSYGGDIASVTTKDIHTLTEQQLCGSTSPETEDASSKLDSDVSATLDKKNRARQTSPAHTLASSSDPDMTIVRFALETDASLLYREDGVGELPIHKAVKCSRDLALIRYLCELYPVGLKHRCSAGRVPLLTAVMTSSSSGGGVGGAIDASSISSRLSGTTSEVARSTRTTTVEIVRYLLSKHVNSIDDVDDKGNNVMHIAVMNGAGLAVCELLFSYKPGLAREKNKYGNIPLHFCRHDQGVASFLLRSFPGGAKVQNSVGNSPLFVAATYASLEVFQLIEDAYPDAVYESVGEFGTPVHQACVRMDGDCSIIEYLCSKVPDTLCMGNSDGELPIHWTAVFPRTQSVSVLKTLIKAYPVSVEVPDLLGRLPVHRLFDERSFSSDSQSIECFRILLENYPASVDIADGEGYTVYDLCGCEPDNMKRMVLRIKPQLNIALFQDLNFRARLPALLLAYRGRETDNLFHRIRNLPSDPSVFDIVLRFL